MSKIDRDSLLDFLSKPRFAHEVAAHYGVSEKLASFHLKKVVRSGAVLTSERPVFQAIQDSDGMPRKFGGVAYVFRKSPVLADGWAKFTAEVPASSGGTTQDVFSIKFVAKRAVSLGEEGVTEPKLSAPASEVTASLGEPLHHLKGEEGLTSKFDLSSTKVRLGKRKTIGELPRYETRSANAHVASFTQAGKTRLFQALLNEPLPFPDIHRRFGVSKQIIKGLVKNGLLVEVWGPQDIGVGFKLTMKGKIRLRELEAAARVGPRMKESTFIRLKHGSAI